MANSGNVSRKTIRTINTKTRLLAVGSTLLAFIALECLLSVHSGILSGVQGAVGSGYSEQYRRDIAERLSARKKRARARVVPAANNEIQKPTLNSVRAATRGIFLMETTQEGFVSAPDLTAIIHKTGFGRSLSVQDDPPLPGPCQKEDLVIDPSSVDLPTNGTMGVSRSFIIKKRVGHDCAIGAFFAETPLNNGISDIVSSLLTTGDPAVVGQVSYNVSANMGPDETCPITDREISVIRDHDLLGGHVVNQQRAPCRFNITDLMPINVAPGEEPELSFEVTNNGNSNCRCDPSVSVTGSNPEIILNLHYDRDQDPKKGLVVFKAASNLDHASKSAFINVGTQSKKVIVSPAACAFTLRLEPGDGSFRDIGGSGSIAVTPAGSGCTWSAIPSKNWIQIVSGSESNPTVMFNVKQNLDSGFRIGGIMIGGQSVTILQEGAQTDCSYTVPRDSAFIPSAGGGPFSFTVTVSSITGTVCDWTAVPSDQWIKTASKGRGTGKVEYTIDENRAGSPKRSGNIVVGNTAFLITQEPGAGSTSGCSFDIPTSVPSISSRGDSGHFAVKTSDECSWEAVSSDNTWIKTTSKGKGDGAVEFTVEPNTDGRQRSGHISVGNKMCSITQDEACSYELPASERTSISVGELRQSFGFTVLTTPKDCKWRASKEPLAPTKDAGWIILKNTSGGNGEPLVFNVDPNPDSVPRGGIIKIDNSNITFTVQQTAKPVKGPTCADPTPLAIGQIIYGELSDTDCTSDFKGSARKADHYLLLIEGESKRIAINVSSSGFDPIITLSQITKDGEVPIADDDGAGFSNSRLPQATSGDAFTLRQPGTYKIEVSSFKTTARGKYTILVASDQNAKNPTVLGAVEDLRTLIVTGENFSQGARIMVDGVEQTATKNDNTRPRNALILAKPDKQARKAIRDGCASLQVKNLDGNTSVVFVYKECQ